MTNPRLKASLIYGFLVSLGALVLGNTLGPRLALTIVHLRLPREMPLLFLMVSFRWLPAFAAAGWLSGLAYRRYCSHWNIGRSAALCAINVVIVASVSYPLGIAISLIDRSDRLSGQTRSRCPCQGSQPRTSLRQARRAVQRAAGSSGVFTKTLQSCTKLVRARASRADTRS
jgi:hypothetical protein